MSLDALVLTENAAFNAFSLLLLGPEPADADTEDEYDDKLFADPIGPAVKPLKRNKIDSSILYKITQYDIHPCISPLYTCTPSKGMRGSLSNT